MAQLETYEWSNIWWEHADDSSKPRILIAGDSITVGYRGDVNSIFSGEIYADAYSTSKSVDNPFYLEEMDLVIRQSPAVYDMIHFNCGLHGFHLCADDYAVYYENAVSHILELYPNTKLALVLSTPVTAAGHPDQLDEKKNAVVQARNEKVAKIAEKRNLPVNDLYTPMLDKPELRENDGLHYNSKGCRYQAELVAQFIRDYFIKKK